MTEEIARYCLKDLFQPLIGRLCEEKGRSKYQGRYLWWFLQISLPYIHCGNNIWGGGERIGSLSSHIGILDDEFEELLATGKLSKCWSWYKMMGIRVKKHRYHSINCIAFDDSFAPLQWAHLPRHQNIGGNTCPAWFFRPNCGWVEISSGENIDISIY